MENLRIVVTNDSGEGGTALTPFWFGFHDENFDLFDVGGTASAGLEAVAEDGNFALIAAELTAADADAQGGVVLGAAGPIVATERASLQVSVDGSSNAYLSLAAMLLPSNDAFVGTSAALEVFDADGNFLGAQDRVFLGENVYDAGTEENTELDAAFINQMGPNTGITENGVIRLHDGFNGSYGNPDGEQTILGGTNAFGQFIDPVAADFTLPGAEIATVHVNTVNVEDGSSNDDRLAGSNADDIFTGGNGQDVLIGRNGWDDLFGGAGDDELRGGNGNDLLDGGAGQDELRGGNGNDVLDGGEGDDLLFGHRGDDYLKGGAGNDELRGGLGDDALEGGAGNDLIRFGNNTADTFIFADGDGADRVANVDVDDYFVLSLSGVSSYEELVETARETSGDLQFDLGGGDSITLLNTTADELTVDQFIFA